MIEHVIEGRPGGGHGHRVATEGRHTQGTQPIHQIPTGDHPTDRETVPQTLGEGQRIRHHPVVADTEETRATPSPRRLDLVRDEEDAVLVQDLLVGGVQAVRRHREPDRKSTRLNSSHVSISYAVFCLKKKKKLQDIYNTYATTSRQLRW